MYNTKSLFVKFLEIDVTNLFCKYVIIICMIVFIKKTAVINNSKVRFDLDIPVSLKKLLRF